MVQANRIENKENLHKFD
ncbi:hypothetical protein L345_01023 [Ophiophagus hannah]|uniref:Uncharacterized protein n=1 Tax=Ophiophagus hannah TaxID=8665 RepID=V8PGZ4_OPHHA|nr:hypothetical protein L345_01023 [Ophiophagus hannah]